MARLVFADERFVAFACHDAPILSVMIRQPDFGGARIKTERAKEHVRDLEVLVQGFLQTNPYELVRYNEPQTGDLFIMVSSARQPPLRWSAVVGDAVHNLRSSLDLLVCEIVRVEGNTVTEQTGFPIFKSAQAFESGHLAKVKGAPEEAIDCIKRLKPYKGGAEPLWWLHRLDIADKHRLLITVGGAFRSVIHDMRRTLPDWETRKPMPFARPAPDPLFPLKEGTVIYRVEAANLIGPAANANQNPEFTFDIAFGEREVVQGEPLLPTLHQLIDFVEEVIEAFGTLFSQEAAP